MNVNPLSNIANPYIQSLTNTAMSAIGSAISKITGAGAGASTSGVASSLAIPQDGAPQLSPFAQLMSTLQQIQQQSPSQYQQLTQQIANNLQAASQTAQASGNTTQAQQLNQLSGDFQNASTNNQLPNVADLAQLTAGHHHHHHQGGGSSQIPDPNSSSTSGTGSSTANQSLSQLFGQVTGTSAQNAALNPMNIILSTLQSDGITVGN